MHRIGNKMSISYEWNIKKIETDETNNLNDVVVVVHWLLKATDQDGVSATTIGNCSLKPPSDTDFTPLSEISKEQIVSWIEESMKKKIMHIAKEQPEESVQVEEERTLDKSALLFEEEIVDLLEPIKKSLVTSIQIKKQKQGKILSPSF